MAIAPPPASRAQCVHCLAVIHRNGTRWVHAETGRKGCSPGSVHQAQPKPRRAARR
jgi:hypothetical protein